MGNKKKIISYTFFVVGILLIIYSWLKSYPISITDYKDFTIRHVYPSFFIGLSIALASLFLIMLNTKKKINKIFCIFGFIFLFYLINFFYPLLPGPDSHYFMGLTKYFIESSNINFDADPYFQWPGLFIFAKFIHLIIGINDVNTIAMIVFILVGFTLSTTIYFIFKQQNEKYAPILTIIYFLIMFYFVNYQYAAQSLAIAILFILIVLTLNKEKNNKLLIIFLFCLLVLTHAFMAVFFIFYLIGCSFFFKIFKNKEENKNISISLLIICSVIYLFYLSFIAVNLFNSLGKVVENSVLEKNNINLNIFVRYINLALKRPVEYNDYLVQKDVLNLSGVNISQLNLNEEAKKYLDNMTSLENIPADFLPENISNKIIEESNPNLKWIKIDNYAQIISRIMTISLIVLLSIGFLILFFQKKIKIEILAIGFAGFLYMVLGTLANILGERGIQLLTVPLCAGAIFFLDNKKFRRLFLIYFVILLVSFPLVIIHNNFDNQLYQEYPEKVAGDFFINLINSISKEEKINDHLFIVGMHTIVYYIDGGLDLSSYKWKYVIGNRNVNFIDYSLNNKGDYLFYSNDMKKSLIKDFRINEERLNSLEKSYEKRDNKIYNNKDTTIYEKWG